MNLFMTEKQIKWMELHNSLEEALDKWWDENCLHEGIPLIGDNVLSIMASSALNTLLAVKSTQEYLEGEGWNPDSKTD